MWLLEIYVSLSHLILPIIPRILSRAPVLPRNHQESATPGCPWTVDQILWKNVQERTNSTAHSYSKNYSNFHTETSMAAAHATTEKSTHHGMRTFLRTRTSVLPSNCHMHEASPVESALSFMLSPPTHHLRYTPKSTNINPEDISHAQPPRHETEEYSRFRT